MRATRILLLAATLAALSGCAILEEHGSVLSEWRVSESRFDGREAALVWHARFEPAGGAAPAPAPSYEVRRSYGPPPRDSAPVPPWERERRKVLASWTFNVAGQASTLGLIRELALAREEGGGGAAPEAPRGAAIIFQMTAGRFRISRTFPAPFSGAYAPSDEDLEGTALDGPARALAAAVRTGDERTLTASGIARLAAALLGEKGPIGPPTGAIRLESVRAKLGPRPIGAAVAEDGRGARHVEVEAGPGDRIRLSLGFGLVCRTPFADRIDASSSPLPTNASVSLVVAGARRVPAAPGGAPGEFQAGPVDLPEEAGALGWEARLAEVAAAGEVRPAGD